MNATFTDFETIYFFVRVFSKVVGPTLLSELKNSSAEAFLSSKFS